MSLAVRWARGIATALAVLGVAGSIVSPINLVTALVYGAGAIGLWLKSPWSGFGLAMMAAMNALAGVFILFRTTGTDSRTLGLALLVSCLSGAVAWLFYEAGRELKIGPMRILAGLPWIAFALFETFALAGGALGVFYTIPTGAMEDTVLIGDHLIVWPNTTVAHGDIVALRYPIDESQTFLKRVIGMPGDRIRIVNKQLILNGAPPQEPYAIHKTDYVDSYRDNFPSQPTFHLNGKEDASARKMLAENVVNGEVVVPEGTYFVLGDNRDNSLDSRFWGFVPRENIVGKPYLVYWSYDAPPEDLSGQPRVEFPWKALKRVRWERVFMSIRGYPLQ